MHARYAHCLVSFVMLTLAACADRPDPARLAAPNFAAGGVGRPTVLVNPNANDNGTAKTIQEGIAMVGSGGNVLVAPGTYDEAIVIDKALTLEAIGGESEPVIVAPSATVNAAIHIATPDPVTIRGLSVRYTGIRGIFGDGVVDITIERASVVAVNPPLGNSALISVINDAPGTGRAHVMVRASALDGSVPSADSPTPPFPQLFGITVAGDIDARLEGNVIRRTGGACVFVRTRLDLGGETNADIVGNDLDECYPLGRAGSILVGPGAPLPSPRPPFTATGVVNVVGNTIRNSTGSCLASSAINYESFGGRIERNRILGVVQPCAVASGRIVPAGIWVGSIRGLPAAGPITVRFNDIEGNAQAGLRVAPNMTTEIDASCNWWGSASGPSGAGPGSGDAVVVEAGAATPAFLPFAPAPIAGTDATSC
jgi:hypothetical protein